MSKRIASRLAAVVLGVCLAAPASATLFNLEAVIDGAQANMGAGTGSAATGSARMTFDDISNLFSWNISWSGLEGNITVAHFHGPALPGANAGVQVNFGAISGLTSPSVGSTIITPLQGADLLAGLWYINIHSDRDTITRGGEIRGQVLRVPEPAVALIFLAGLAGLGFLRRGRV